MRRLEDDDSDNEGADDPDLEREVIAEKLFVGGSDEVSVVCITTLLLAVKLKILVTNIKSYKLVLEMRKFIEIDVCYSL